MTQLVLPRRFTQQPQQAVQVDRSGIGSRIVLATMPAISLRNLASGVAPAIIGTAPNGNFIGIEQYGRDIEVHPAGGTSGYGGLRYGAETIGTSNDFTFVWVGRPMNFSGNTVGSSNGHVMIRGADGSGNGWNLLLSCFGGITTGNQIRASCVDTSPAQLDVSITGLSLVSNRHERFALVKRGATLKLFDWRTRQSASGSAGNGSLRTSTAGIGLSPSQNGAAAGHNKPNTVLAFSDGLDDVSVWSLLDNPWQLFKAPSRPIWIPVSAGGGGAYTLTADSATFSVTGQSTGLKADRRLSAQTATFGLTGNSAGLKVDRRLTATPASFALTGIDAALMYSPLAKVLTADVGSFVLTGNAAALRADRRLSAAVGSYALAAQAANLRAARRMMAQAASYAITGNTTGLRATRRLMANAASYTLTGIDVGLTKSDQRMLSAAAASFALTGIAASLKADRRLLAQAGQIVLTGNQVGMARGFRLGITGSAYAVTGQAATFRRAYRMAAGQAHFALTGNAANLVYLPLLTAMVPNPKNIYVGRARVRVLVGQPRIRTL